MNTMTFDNVKEQLTNDLSHKMRHRRYTPYAIQAAATIWTKHVEPHELTGDTITITTPDCGDITIQGTKIANAWHKLSGRQKEQTERELNCLVWHAQHDKDLTRLARTLSIHAHDELRIYADWQHLHDKAAQFLAKVEQYSTN